MMVITRRIFCVRTYLFILFVAVNTGSLAQPDSVVLSNNIVSRTVKFTRGKEGFYTTSFKNLEGKSEYIKKTSDDFSVSVDGKIYNGSNTTYTSHITEKKLDETKLLINLTPGNHGFTLQLMYRVYDGLPIIRKQLSVTNHSKKEVAITNLDVESLQFEVVNTYMNEVYANYGTILTRIPYKGNHDDAAVLLFNLNAGQGVILGNEAPSVLKRTEIYVNPGKIALGMGLIHEDYPFKKWLKPGETFNSPGTFIHVSNSRKWQDAFEGNFQTFLRKKLGVKLFENKKAPFFIYNTWQPFFDNINEQIIKQCADSLANTGTDLFIIDAGWYKRAGDFTPDPKKFPNGLKPVCEYIRSKGMRAGLWFAIASVHNKSDIAKQHPEWLVCDVNGKAENLHDGSLIEDGDTWSSALRTMSLGSGYYDHVLKLLKGRIKEWGITYLKLDLSIATSAYVNDVSRTGDYDFGGDKIYKDRESSYWAIFERMMLLMKELKKEFPDLLLDCTFETWGRYNLVDFALIQHADYDWLTNFDFAPPEGPISIRQMNYDRSRVIPPSTLLIGNQFMDFPNNRYVYFSMAAGSTLMVGDPRKLTASDKEFYLKWNTWFKEMESKYQFSQFKQSYDVFDRPTDSNWDGCYRINFEKHGGVLFYFRNNSQDEARIFRIPGLDPTVKYCVYSHEDGSIVGIYSGFELTQSGLRVSIDKTYSAKVLGIEKAL
jgi:alpha-galactosidase